MDTRLVAVGLLGVLGVGAHADVPLDGDTELDVVQRVSAATTNDCAGRPSAMPGWPYYKIWDYDSYAVPFRGLTHKWVISEGYYEQSFKLGRASVSTRISDREGWPFGDIKAAHTLIARTVAMLPGGLTQRLPSLNIEIAGHRASARTLYRRDPGPTYTVVFPSRYLHTDGPTFVGNHRGHANFEELLLHELGHVMDSHAGFIAGRPPGPNGYGWSSSGRWRRAMADSPCAVSTYAERNEREDFAESVVAWFAYYGGRNGALTGSDRRKLKHRLGKRFGILNRLMHDRFPDGGDDE